MAYRIVQTAEAQKQLTKLPRPVQKRVGRCYELLAEDPRRAKTRQLQGHPHLRRVHASKDHVVVYTIRESEVMVLIVRVAHRRHVYRRLPPL